MSSELQPPTPASGGSTDVEAAARTAAEYATTVADSDLINRLRGLGDGPDAATSRAAAEQVAAALQARQAATALLRSRAESLQRDLSSVQPGVQDAQNLAGEVSAAEEEVRVLRERSVALSEEAEKLQEVLAMLAATQRAPSAAPDACRSQIAMHNDRRQSFERQAAALETANAQRDAQLQRKNESYRKLLEVSQQVASHNQLLSAEAERLSAAVPDLEQECSELEGQTAREEQMKTEADRLKEAAELGPQLQAELLQLRSETSVIPSLEADKMLLSEACTQMSGDIPELRERVCALEKQSEEVERLRREVAEMRLEQIALGELEREIESLAKYEGDARRAQARNDAMRTEITLLPTLEAQLQRAREGVDEVCALNAERETLCKRLDEAELEVSRRREELTRHDRMRETMLRNLSGNAEAIDARQRVRDQEHVLEMEERRGPLQEEVSDLNRQIAEVEEKLLCRAEQEEAEVQRLQTTLSRDCEVMRSRMQELEEQASAKRQELANTARLTSGSAAETEIASLTALLETERALHDTAQVERRKGLELRKREIEAVRQQLGEVTASTDALSSKADDVSRQNKVLKEKLAAARSPQRGLDGDEAVDAVLKLNEELQRLRNHMRADPPPPRRRRSHSRSASPLTSMSPAARSPSPDYTTRASMSAPPGSPAAAPPSFQHNTRASESTASTVRPSNRPPGYQRRR